MKKTFTATQEIEFRVPDFQKSIQSNSGNILLEDMTDENISAIFDSMKKNALEYKKSKIAERQTKPDQTTNNVVAGRRLANRLQ